MKGTRVEAEVWWAEFQDKPLVCTPCIVLSPSVGIELMNTIRFQSCDFMAKVKGSVEVIKVPIS